MLQGVLRVDKFLTAVLPLQEVYAGPQAQSKIVWLLH